VENNNIAKNYNNNNNNNNNNGIIRDTNNSESESVICGSNSDDGFGDFRFVDANNKIDNNIELDNKINIKNTNNDDDFGSFFEFEENSNNNNNLKSEFSADFSPPQISKQNVVCEFSKEIKVENNSNYKLINLYSNTKEFIIDLIKDSSNLNKILKQGSIGMMRNKSSALG
jgi:hypothetical protein